MAKKTYYKQQKKKSHAAAVIAVILAILLVGTLAGGALGWVKAINYAEQLKGISAELPSDDTTDIPPEDTANTPASGGLILSDEDSHGVSLMSELISPDEYGDYGISAQAETAYTLTARVLDENGSTEGMPQAVEFSADWAKPWSLNVLDYISIQQTSENSAIVTCIAVFSVPITITIKAVGSDKYTTKQCDYVKRVMDISCFPANTGIVVDMPTTLYKDIEPNYTMGTVQGEVTFDYIMFYIERNFLTALLNTSYYKYFAQQCAQSGLELDLGSEVSKQLNCKQNNFQLQFDLDDFFLTNMRSEQVNAIKNTVGLDYFKYAVIEAATQVTNCINYEIYYTYTYNGVVYSSGKTGNFPPVQFNTSCLGTLPAVGSVEVNGSGNFIF